MALFNLHIFNGAIFNTVSAIIPEEPVYYGGGRSILRIDTEQERLSKIRKNNNIFMLLINH
jgi:hypothetical protein